MISTEQHQAAAALLTRATRDRIPIAPITETWPTVGLDDAYAIQTVVVGERIAAGAHIAGWKVGLTSQAMQRQLGVDQPDFAPLLDDMAVTDGADLPSSELIAPRVEGELAFRLAADLQGDVTFEEVCAAIDLVVPALEIIDSRIVDWRISLADTIADHASCGRYVVGANGASLADVNLETVELVLDQDDEEVGRGTGDAVLGNPLRAVAWLTSTIDAYGQHLAAGQIVLAGALHAAVPATAGHRVRARFSEPALGSVSVNFT